MAKAKLNAKKRFVATIISWLEGLLALSHAFERLLVDVVVGYVPLFAPIIPASLAFDNLLNVLSMGFCVSLIGAAVVEFLGLGTVATVMLFADYNASRNEGDPKAPVWVAGFVAVFYLIVVLTVNVLLDDSPTIERVAKLLMSSLGVAGALTITLRGAHTRRVEAKTVRDARMEAEQKALEEDDLAYKRQVALERRSQKHELRKLELELKSSENKPADVKVSEKVSESSANKAETFGQFKGWRQLPMEHKVAIAKLVKGTSKRLAMEMIVETYLVSERVAYGWIEYAERDFPSVEVAVSSNQ